MENIKIRNVSIKDYAHVQAIGRETFYETFAQSNSEDDMQKYLSDSFNDEKVKAELSSPESLFYIAWQNDTSIGYLKINFGDAQTEIQSLHSLEIERIYVKPLYHGKKIGQLLYEKALAIALQKGKKSIWLGVWNQNSRAIRFYEKNGFVAFDKHSFLVGKDEQTDIMMQKILS